jgi:ABC-type uncharacterized transport system fused permease/ATPase subunit
MNEKQGIKEEDVQLLTGLYHSIRLFILPIFYSLDKKGNNSLVRQFEWFSKNSRDRSYVVVLLLWMSLTGIVEWLGLLLMHLPSQLIVAVVNKNQKEFSNKLWKGCSLIAGISIIKGVAEFLAGIFYSKTRGLLLDLLWTSWGDGVELISPTLFNHSEKLKALDGLDQRIGVDIDRYAEILSKLLPIIVTCIPMIIIYGWMCFKNVAWYTPIGIIGHFVLFAVIAHGYLTKKHSQTVANKEKQEGVFRHSLALVLADPSAHREEISMTQYAVEYFSVQLQTLSRNVLGQLDNLATWKGWLELVRAIQAYSGSILTYVIVGFALFSSESNFMSMSESTITGIFTLNTAVTMSLIGKMSDLFTILNLFGAYLGHGYRIYPLFSGAIPLEKKCPCTFSQTKNDLIVSVARTTISTPDNKRVLLRDLNLQLFKGENLFITGRSGSGKTSILRVILGVWPVSNVFASLDQKESQINEIYFKYANSQLSNKELYISCTDKNILDYMTITSRPILVRGSILDQIMYPFNRSFIVADEIEKTNVFRALGEAGLTTFQADAIFEAEEWGNRLSSGEIQRIGIARALYHQPKLVILDEATCALDQTSEEEIYKSLQLNLPNSQFIIISHKPNIPIKVHKMLTIHLDSTYTLDAPSV